MISFNAQAEKPILRELVAMLPAAFATAGPPLGPLLGQFGVNTPAFCKSFNEHTKVFSEFCSNDQQILVVVKIFVYEDKTFSFKVEKPTVGFLLQQIRIKVSIDGANYTILRPLGIGKLIQFKFGHTNDPDVFKRRLFSILGTVRSTGLPILR